MIDVLVRIIQALMPLLIEIVAKAHPDKNSDEHKHILNNYISSHLFKK